MVSLALDESQGDLFHGHPFGGIVGVDAAGQFGQGGPAGVAVQWLVGPGAEDAGKVSRLDAPQDQVGVGDRQMAVFTVADRSGMGAGRFRADHEHTVFEKEAAAAAGRHGLDMELGGLDAHTGGLAFENQLVVPAETRDIRGGAAHIEADHGTAGNPSSVVMA